MNDQPGASTWRNPLAVENAGAERISRALTLGADLRRKVAAGCALGTFVLESPVPATLGAMALAGFDFVVIDMEHSTIDFSRLETLIGAGHAAGLATLVRPWGEDVGLIGKVLDIGANGIMASHVESPARARAIVEQARFAPLGNRGFSPLTKYDALGEPLRVLGDATYVVVQIEGRQALANIAADRRGPGHRCRIRRSLRPGAFAGRASRQPAGVRRRRRSFRKAVPDGVALGIYIDDPAKCGDWAARRFALQCVSFDGRMLANGARSVVTQAKQAISESTTR